MEEIMDYSERRMPFQDLMCRFTRVQDVEKAIEQTLPSKCTIKIEEGDTLVVHTPGGGGYGDPRRRAPKERPKGCSEWSRLHREGCARAVSIRNGLVDEARTRLLRAEP
jgi:N-methylhydantoinase B/oxoprolinase/acetone carboxylase alpha subunit